MNKKIGNEYEEKLVQLLASEGWWCHCFAYKPEGQPCDVVALKNNVPFLVDVKHCAEDRFSFNNIQPNQKNCFKLAYQRGNKNLGFCVYFAKYGWKYIHYLTVERLEKEGCKSIKAEDCQTIYEGVIWNC